jgi:acetyltransferase-like isoleucine patch superfamily enzyme
MGASWQSRVGSIIGSLRYLIRSELSRTRFVRHLRYQWAFPEFSVDPTANLAVAGKVTVGAGAAAGEGCNILVPQGASLEIGAGCYLGRYVELGPGGDILIGDQTSIQDRSILVGDVRVGRYCVLSLNVLLTSGRHYFDRWSPILIRDQDLRVASDLEMRAVHSRPIVVEEDCWLGMNSVIMPGVTIGRGSIVGSNAVVTSNLPPYSVAVGVPARIVRQRLDFTPPPRLDWSEDDHVPYFYRGFEISDAERRENARFGGHVARRGFALWPAGDKGSFVVVRIRSVTNESCSLIYEGSTYVLTEHWQDLRLQRGSEQLAFDLKGGPVAVSQVHVE